MYADDFDGQGSGHDFSGTLWMPPTSIHRYEAHKSADSFIKQIKSLGESNSTSVSATVCSFVIVRCYEIGHGALDSLLLAVVTV